MKERIAKAIRGCCRLKRRMRTLIRNVPPIATDPDSKLLNVRDDVPADLANSLRFGGRLETGLMRC